MNFSKDEFLVFYFSGLGYSGSEDFIKNLLLKGIIEAFEQLKTGSFLEEKIRDSLVRHLETESEEIKALLKDKF